MEGVRSPEGSPPAGILPPREEKAAWVQAMFGRIARHYDLMNGLMTLGRDQAWRRYTVAQLGLGLAGERDEGQRLVLDVATGTGDLALEVVRQVPRGSILCPRCWSWRGRNRSL